jgi:hypothetical protein
VFLAYRSRGAAASEPKDIEAGVAVRACDHHEIRGY